MNGYLSFAIPHLHEPMFLINLHDIMSL